MSECRSRTPLHGMKPVIAVLAVIFLLSPTPVPGQSQNVYSIPDLKALESAFVELAADLQPSVVAVRTYSLFPPRSEDRTPIPISRSRSRGSGFIIDPDGYIVTNFHVLEDCDLVKVFLHNGLDYDAEIVQRDERSDLAVLKIDADHLKAVTLGDLEDVQVGEWAIAAGNPFGLATESGRSSVSFGTVSALGRELTGRLARSAWDLDAKYYGNLIETTAAINPGCSGGPLFDIEGKVIGVIAAIETTSGVTEGHGFAIPIDKNTRRIIEKLKSGEPVRYGFLGVDVRDPIEGRRPRFVRQRSVHGAEITGIAQQDGPAARAGLRPADLILEFDGVPIQDKDHLIRQVSFTPVGAEVQVVYLRDNTRRTASVTVADRFEMLKANQRERE